MPQELEELRVQLYGWNGATKERMTTLRGGILAAASTPIPPGYVQLFDYDGRTDGQVVYQALNLMGSLEADTTWLIFKWSYNGDGFATKLESAWGSYSNRASLFA